MSCMYEKNDCAFKNNEDKCLMCVNGSKYKKGKFCTPNYGLKKNINKITNRMGSQAEMINHQSNTATVSASMTPNSGAGKVKGDEQIKGLVNIMQEVKTQEVVRARGHSQFTIKREWLDKLEIEGTAEDMEFWYLIFSFKNTDEQQYVVIDKSQMNDMIATIINDRKIAKEAQLKIDIANKQKILTEAENTKLLAEIDLLKTQLEQFNDKGV